MKKQGLHLKSVELFMVSNHNMVSLQMVSFQTKWCHPGQAAPPSDAATCRLVYRSSVILFFVHFHACNHHFLLLESVQISN